MSGYTSVILLTGVIFLALILNLALKKEYNVRITSAFIVTAAVSGLFIYGYGYSLQLQNIPLAVLRSLMAVCGMFVSKSDYSVVAAVPFFASDSGRFFFWLVHFMAQYATASATIAAIGARALRRLRLWLACFGDLSLIYGINRDSVSFARQLTKQTGQNMVFVDEKPQDSLTAAISSFGGVVVSDKNAIWPDKRFLSSMGIRRGKRKFAFYALHSDYSKNVSYTFALKNALQSAGISPQQTSLTMLGDEELHMAPLQAYGDEYGFGNVTVYNLPDMVARLLVQKYPPCNTLTFDENAAAAENFDAVIIGFGRVGQSVMKQLVINGQFYGSSFRLGIFAPDCSKVTGYLSFTNHSLLENYDISFYDFDGRSHNMYSYLKDNLKTLKYIAICTGSDKINMETGGEISRFLAGMGSTAGVYRCSYSGVTCLSDGSIPPQQWPVFTTELLCTAAADNRAILLNHTYCSNDKTPLENWARCDYFSRMSSRASADFMPAMLKAAGRTPQQAAENWNLTPQMLENMARTEHLRWNAFHFSMGFEKMTEENYSQRARQYLREKQAAGTSRIRIGKDMVLRQHACLVDWDSLDSLSARENRLTGKNIDYKQMDRDNVLAIPQLIKAELN